MPEPVKKPEEKPPVNAGGGQESEEVKKVREEYEEKIRIANANAEESAKRANRFKDKYKKVREGKIDDKKNKDGEGEDEELDEIDQEEKETNKIKEVARNTVEEARRDAARAERESKMADEIEARTDNAEERSEILKIARSFEDEDPLIAVESAVAAYDRKKMIKERGTGVLPPIQHSGAYDGASKHPKAVPQSTIELGEKFGHSEKDLKEKNHDEISIQSWARRKR